VRAYNCLKRAGITKVGEIIDRLEKGPEELAEHPHFGQKSLNELMDQLKIKGYWSTSRCHLRSMDSPLRLKAIWTNKSRATTRASTSTWTLSWQR